MHKQSDGTPDLLLSAFSSFLSDTKDIVFFKDTGLVYRAVSPAFVELVGLSSPSELVGRTDFDLFDGPLAEHYVADDKRMLKSGAPLAPYIEPLPGKNGRPRYSSTFKSLVRDPSGKIVGVYGVARDVTREYEAKLHYDRELRYLFELPPDAYAAVLFDVTAWRVCDSHIRELGSNLLSRYDTIEEYMQNAFKSVVEDEEAKNFFQYFSPETIQALYSSGKRHFSLEYLRLQADGAKRWVRDEGHFLVDPVTGHTTLMLIVLDVDGARREQDKLVRAAEQDSMTGLLNHDATFRQVRQCLEGTDETRTHALFIIDIDNFKNVNDSLGHLRGDSVIMDIAAAIKRLFRDTDITGRIGGDEFLVLMKNIDRPPSIAAKARELVEALQYFYREGDKAVELSASVGISIYGGRGKTLETLYAEADAALYQAKSGGKNRYAFANAADGYAYEPEDTVGALSSSVHLRTLLENMEGCILLCRVTDDIHFFYASPNLYKEMGRDSSSVGLNGETFFSVLYPPDLEGLRSAIFEAAQTGKSMQYTCRVYARFGGGVEWRRIRCARLPDDGHGVRRVIMVMQDITTLKGAEEQLILCNQRCRAVLDQSPAMIVEADLRTGALSFSGIPAQELGLAGSMQSIPKELSVPLKDVREMIFRLQAGDSQGVYRLCFTGTKAPTREFSIRFTIFRDAQGFPCHAVGVAEPLPC